MDDLHIFSEKNFPEPRHASYDRREGGSVVSNDEGKVVNLQIDSKRARASTNCLTLSPFERNRIPFLSP